MSRNVEIKRTEVVDLRVRVQRLSVLKSIKYLLDNNSNRISELGFNINDFANILTDIEYAQEQCNQWWNNMANKYKLPFNCKFHIVFNSNVLF